MEPVEAADQIKEIEGDGKPAGGERFRSFVALIIAIEAVLLTISSLGGENAAKAMVNANIQASDTWAFFQAKNVRQTVYELSAEEIETALLLAGSGVPEEARRKVEATVAAYRAKAKRYESEPDPKDPGNPLRGEGKKELMARARDFEAKRDHASRQDPNFDYATALFQIAIVLGSIAILGNSRPVLVLSLVLAAGSTALMLNGFYLVVELPF